MKIFDLRSMGLNNRFARGAENTEKGQREKKRRHKGFVLLLIFLYWVHSEPLCPF